MASGTVTTNWADCVEATLGLAPRNVPAFETIRPAPHGTMGLVSWMASDSRTPRARAVIVTSPGLTAVVLKSIRTSPAAGTFTLSSWPET